MSAIFSIGGKAASARELAEALALARQHKAKVAQAAREAAGRDADARRVGAAIRRALAMDIAVRPASVSGSRHGGVRLRQFEGQLGLLLPMRASKVGAGGQSSFHLKLTPRGLGNQRRAKDRPYQRGEAVRAVRYILREAAREIEGGGIVSNISLDPDRIAGFFSALEELEIVGGRDNANVYTSIVVSLPHELTGPEREKLLADICRPLAALDLPYAAVLHAPDPEGDQRNNHAHILTSWRPFERRPDGFAVATTTLEAMNTTEFVTSLRQNVSAAMNTAMLAAGHTRRFTAEKQPRSVPVKEGAQKLTPGIKHRQRRATSIEAAKAEKSWLGERASALAAISSVAETWLFRDVTGRAAVIQAVQEREKAILQAYRSAASVEFPEVASEGERVSPTPTPSQVVPIAMPVSHAKLIAVVAPSAPTVRPVAAAQPTPATGRQSLAPAESRHAEPLAPAAGAVASQQEPSLGPTHNQGDKRVRSQRHRLAALKAASQVFATRESDSLAVGGLSTAKSLARLGGLSSLGLVRDLGRVGVPPNDVPSASLARGNNGAAAEGPEDARTGLQSVRTDDGTRGSQGGATIGSAGLTASLPKKKVPLTDSGKTDQLTPLPATSTKLVSLPIAPPPVQTGAGRDGRQINVPREAARARETKVVVEALAAISSLPIRPVGAGSSGRERSFTLVIEKALEEDAGLIRNAAKLQADMQIQQVLASKWEALLARLRADLIIKREQRPPTGGINWLGTGDMRYRAALSAAVSTDEYKDIIVDARAYWDARAQPQVPTIKAEVQAVSPVLEADVEDDDIDLATQAAFMTARLGKAK